jgi:hypothetical protein
MRDNHILTTEESRKLHRTVQTVEFTGAQIAILANAVAFNLVHNDCIIKDNPYGQIYHDECHKLHDYLESFVEQIIGDTSNEKRKPTH